MRNQAGEKEETEEARAETGTGKATVRRNREEKERKNRGLVVRIQNWGGRKDGETAGVRKRKGSGDAPWNGRPREGRKREQKTRVSREEAAAEIEAGGRRKEIADETIR